MNSTLIPTSEEWFDIRVRLLSFIIFIEFIQLLLQIIFLFRNEHFVLDFCGYLKYENVTPFQQQLRHESGKHATVILNDVLPKVEEMVKESTKKQDE
jgi:hypothetical protein